MPPSPTIRYDDALPITHRRDELLATIRDHQVVVVAGETGSGKSTQLPKMCLELGRGADGRMIGHTQPRRVAARSIAQRIASELGTSVGGLVGSSVRFDDQVGDDTAIRVMTDGILLAELQRDRRLRRYDTLIVDEAHERSLNIDFLLGYLRQLLPRRPDLKLIVTSATIDTERFAAHFAAADGTPAPIVEVTGRTYPVEVRYRPFGADADEASQDDASTDGPPDDRDQVQAVCDAVTELRREGPGDVLVFFSGEREIHDAADALRELEFPDTEILPLYARLSSAEQQRVFQSHPGRRIVLATNVAETSITVPGVRYVVDTGTARTSRYSRRLKVQQLPIEPISRASADQRAGRCGRVAPGICIRLYTEDDLLGRPEFTEPEILRTNLASVILQMTALGLGDVAAFPFVEPPDHRSIRDGYLLLEELAAIEEPDEHGVRRLTEVGRRLARLPIDPRLGRMVIEADRRNCVREVLVIAAALSIQDPRERPQEHAQRAAELHRRFDVEGSDLLSIVALWDHLRARQRELSSNRFRRMCRDEYLHHLRIREWSDLFSQLRRVAGELGIRPGTEAGHPDHVHRSVLAGLLSHVGMRDRETREYVGARGARFVIARGSVMTRKHTPWVMAAELVETNRLYARRVAAIEPEWAEELAGHLVKRSYGEPRWDARAGRAVCTETVTLYGLPIVSDRTVGYDRVDREEARAWFVRHALVEGDWRTRKGSLHGFVRRNAAFADRVRAMEQRVRRVDLLDPDVVFDHFEALVGSDVVSARHFDRWWERVRHDEPDLLDLTDELLAAGAGFRFADFPDTWRQGDLHLPLSYRFEPGNPLDGVTVHVPLTALNQVSSEGFDWQVPGHRFDVVAGLVRSLPKDVRRRLIPLNETVNDAFDRLGEPSGRLVDALADALREVSGVTVRPSDLDPERLDPHLRLAFVVEGADGTVHDAGRDLDAIHRRLAATAREAIAEAAPLEERRGITSWDELDVDEIPRSIVTPGPDGHRVEAYPALLDDGDSVSLRVLTNPDLQHRVMLGGVRRLLLLGPTPSARDVARRLGKQRLLSLAAADVAVIPLAGDCVVAAVDRLLDDHVDAHGLPFDAPAFAALARSVRPGAQQLAVDTLDAATDVVIAANAVRARLARMRAPALADTVADATDHLDRLVRDGFVVRAGSRRLPDVVRYVRGIDHRLEHLGGDIARDHRRMAEVVPIERRYAAWLRSLHDRPVPPEAVELGWQLEELRMSVFAQSLGVHAKVSPQRLTRTLTDLSA